MQHAKVGIWVCHIRLCFWNCKAGCRLASVTERGLCTGKETGVFVAAMRRILAGEAVGLFIFFLVCCCEDVAWEKNAHFSQRFRGRQWYLGHDRPISKPLSQELNWNQPKLAKVSKYRLIELMQTASLRAFPTAHSGMKSQLCNADP